MGFFYTREIGPLLISAAAELLAQGVLGLLGPPGTQLVFVDAWRPLDGSRVELTFSPLTGVPSERMTPLIVPATAADGFARGTLAVVWPGRPTPIRLDPLVVLHQENHLMQKSCF